MSHLDHGLSRVTQQTPLGRSSTPCLCSECPTQRRMARCPLRTMSMNTLSIPRRNTRTPQLLGMTMIPVRFHWTRVPAAPTPCAGIIGLGQGARRPVTPSSMVAAEGTPTVLGPGRPVSTAACPRQPTVKGQVLPRAEVQSSIPWRSRCLSWTLPSLPLGARGLSARERA